MLIINKKYHHKAVANNAFHQDQTTISKIVELETEIQDLKFSNEALI